MLLHPMSVFKLPVFLLFYFSVSGALAQVYNSSISVGTGRTGRASVAPADSFLLNPATMVHLRGRQLYGSVADNEFAIALSDNGKGTFMPGALGFTEKKRDVGTVEFKTQVLSFAVAEFATAKFAAGLTLHYYNFSFGEESEKQFNGDIGFIFTPDPRNGLALVIYNVAGESEDVPEALRTNTTVGFGYNYVINNAARLRVDGTTDEEVMLGVENYLNDFIITRIGYSHNFDQEVAHFHLGLGFNGPKFAINYAFETNLEESGESRHSVDLGIPF